jgi:hypothetical protein
MTFPDDIVDPAPERPPDQNQLVHIQHQVAQEGQSQNLADYPEVTLHPEHGTGRLHDHRSRDVRDGDFLARRALTPKQLLAAAKATALSQYEYNFPRDYQTIDQGNTPRCVGFSSKQWLTAGLVRNPAADLSADDLYKGAQENDEWEGTNYDGSSGRGVCKFLQKEGYIGPYLWLMSANEAAAWMLAKKGPILAGTVWTDSMFDPVEFKKGKQKNRFFVNLEKSQIPRGGGHEYGFYEVDMNLWCPDGSRGAFKQRNTWGPNWGDEGQAYFPFTTFNALLLADGDCVAPTELKHK